MLADHDLPFSGPLGLTSFIIDFLLSPADLQVTDGVGLRTGNFGGQFLSEIPDSHPCYLMKGMYLLPTNAALTRKIVGNGNGNYTFNSIMPNGASIVLQGVATQPGPSGHRRDQRRLRHRSASRRRPARRSRCRSPAIVGNQARALSISGVGGGPADDVDITVSPELNVVRVGNRGTARNLTVKALSVANGGQPVDRNLPAVAVPAANDLAVTVTDWNTLDLQAQAVSFQ